MVAHTEIALLDIQNEIIGATTGIALNPSVAITDEKPGTDEFAQKMGKTREQLSQQRLFSTTLSQLFDEAYKPTLDVLAKISLGETGIVKLIDTDVFQLRIYTEKPKYIRVTNLKDKTYAEFKRTPINLDFDDPIKSVAGSVGDQQYIFKQTASSQALQTRASNSKFAGAASLEQFIFRNFDNAQDHLSQHNLIEGIRKAAKLNTTG